MELDRLEVIIQAESKKANAELDKMINKLNQVSSAINSMNANTFAKTQEVRSSGTFSPLSQITRLVASFYSIKRGIDFVGRSIEKSMSYIETVNLFQTSFKKIGVEAAEELGMAWGSEAADTYAKAFLDRADKFNDMLVDALTLDPQLMRNYQAVFAQMTNSMNLIPETSMNIAETFTLLGNDIASLWNIDTDKAMKKLQAGLAGQIRPLRELGIDISKTSLEMYALNYGIEDSVEHMSQAAKVQLRYLAIMEQAEVAFGDMAKTLDSPANQLRILNQQWTNLSRSIGNVFLPVVTKVLPYINGLVIALRRLVDALAIALGYETPDYSDTNIYKDLTGDIGDMENAIEDTIDANEKLKRSLMKWDELNILRENKIKVGYGSGYKELDEAIQRKTISYMQKFQEELEKASNKAKDIADNISNFFKKVDEKMEPTTKAFKKLWDEGLSKVAGFIGDNWKNLYKEFLEPVGSWTLGEGLPRLAETANRLLNAINWDKLSSALGNLYEALSKFTIDVGRGLISFIEKISEILKPILATIAELLADALNWLAEAIKKIPPEVAVSVGGAIGGIALAVLLFDGATAISGIINSLKKAFSGFLSVLSSHPLLALAEGLMAIAGAALAYETFKFNESEFGKLVKAIKQYNDEVDEMFKKFDLDKQEVENKFGGLKLIADKYFELADQPFLSEENKDLLLEYTQILRDNFPELKDLIDEQTGAYRGTKEEIYGIIEASRERAMEEAKYEMLVELYKRMYEGQKLLKQAQDELTKAENEHAEAVEKNQHRYYGFNTELVSTSGKLRKAQQNVESLETNLESIYQEIDLLTKATTDYGNSTETTMNDIDTAVGNTSDTIQSFADSAKTNLSNTGNYFDEARKKVKTFATRTAEEMEATKKAISNALEEMGRKVANYQLPPLQLRLQLDDSALRNFSVTNPNYRVAQAFATGGYPETGQLFLAREAGPELVGTIGNKTAVVNNQDIVQAVSQGVAMAVSAVLGNQGGKQVVVENIMYLDDEVVYRSYNKAKRANDLRLNPVGG